MTRKSLILLTNILINFYLLTSPIIANPVSFKQPEPPPDSPKTGRAKGGASRGQCLLANSTSEVKITPLLPVDGWGLTASTSPTLWLYISYSSDTIDKTIKAELSVEERKTDRKLEPKSYSFELPKSSGIFSITVPYSLDVNNWYRWYLVVNCQPQSSLPNDILELGGFIYRKELNVPNSSNLVDFYITNNAWYDAFNQAALLHCKSRADQEFKDYWRSLLKSEDVGLGELSDRSIICDKLNSG